MKFADIILPLPIRDTYTYSVPDEFLSDIQIGHRVEVQFGSRKKYAGIVARLHEDAPDYQLVKPILTLLDDRPIISELQLNLWQIISAYYVATLGEVMNAALPAGIKLNSETIYIGHDELNHSLDQLDGDEYTLAAAILYQSEIKHRDVEILLNKKRVYPVIKALLNKGLIEIKEVLKSIYKPKKEKIVVPLFENTNESLGPILEQVKNARKQGEIILFMMQKLYAREVIRVKDIEERFPPSAAALKGLLNKGLISFEYREISRHGDDSEVDFANIVLSPEQERAFNEIKTNLVEKKYCFVTWHNRKRQDTHLSQAH